ncbi:MAG: septum formation initiator family protein [Treponema sp.]|nr:septum formation initiator family protein [Treponema sp.]
MNKFHFLLSVFIGTFIYVMISFCFGSNGLWAESQLKEQRNILSMHINDLSKQQESLAVSYNAIQKDKDVIASYARKIGYVADNEKIIKISGLPTIYDLNEKVEKGYFKIAPKYFPEWICKVCGFVVFFVINLLLTLKNILKKSYKVINTNGSNI